MSRKPTAPRPRRGRQNPKAPSSPSVSISFGMEELQFLIQTLRELPIKGTPDSLAQALPLIQTVRLKFATAAQKVAASSPLQETDAQPPAEAPAAE